MDNIFHPGSILLIGILFALVSVYLTVKAAAGGAGTAREILLEARSNTVAIGGITVMVAIVVYAGAIILDTFF